MKPRPTLHGKVVTYGMVYHEFHYFVSFKADKGRQFCRCINLEICVFLQPIAHGLDIIRCLIAILIAFLSLL